MPLVSQQPMVLNLIWSLDGETRTRLPRGMLALIIWGSRGVVKNLGQGQFNCPRCQQMTPFQHQKVGRYFTLYFIALFPIGAHTEFIECQYCRGKFQPSMLQLAPPQQPGWGGPPQQNPPQQGYPLQQPGPPNQGYGPPNQGPPNQGGYGPPNQGYGPPNQGGGGPGNQGGGGGYGQS
jgi:zinc-ribbon family